MNKQKINKDKDKDKVNKKGADFNTSLSFFVNIENEIFHIK